MHDVADEPLNMLFDAAVLIDDEVHWTQCAYAIDDCFDECAVDDDQAVAWCAAGALMWSKTEWGWDSETILDHTSEAASTPDPYLWNACRLLAEENPPSDCNRDQIRVFPITCVNDHTNHQTVLLAYEVAMSMRLNALVESAGSTLTPPS